MDNGNTIRLTLTLDCREEEKETAIFDFKGNDPEKYGNCNAPRAITKV